MRSERDKTQARCKYIISSIDGNWCKISKFVKSQIRAKQYKVKLSEIYPIVLNTLSHPNVPTVCRDDSDSDSYEEPENITPSVNDNSSGEHSDSQEEEASRRPSRVTRNPNPSYVFSSESDESEE